MKNAELFLHESDYGDLNIKGAAARLSQAIRFRTTGYIDTSRVDYGQFDALQDFLKRSYPHVLRAGIWEQVGHSLLITLPGLDQQLRPALFMAHQDVVPVVPGTEQNWLHGPYSGDIADGFIWGRGALDIKEMLIAEMESAEYLLSREQMPRRTIYLAFGEDEETRSTGAMAMAALLKKRGVTLEYVLDEGAGDVTDAADWGAPGALICPIGMYEKGYADLRLSASFPGGHSSNPFHGTSLGALAQGISAVLDHPTPPCLSEAVLHSLETLRPYISQEPMKRWAAAPKAHEAELLQWFDQHESLYHLIRTTAAPTMISGGAPSGNVMPQDMEAVINFRLIPQDTPEGLLEYLRPVVDSRVKLDWVQQISASTPSEIGSYGFEQLSKTLARYFDRLIFIPAQNRGATDARQYEGICRCVMRFGPFLEEEDISAEGVHGTNERISLRAYAQGIRVLIRLMEETCFRMGAKA